MVKVETEVVEGALSTVRVTHYEGRTIDTDSSQRKKGGHDFSLTSGKVPLEKTLRKSNG